jgi:hypothetical protein
MKQTEGGKMSDNIPNDMPSKIKVGRCKTNKPYIYFLRVPEDYKYDKLKLPEYLRKSDTDKILEEIINPIREVRNRHKKNNFPNLVEYINEMEKALKETLRLADKEMKK